MKERRGQRVGQILLRDIRQLVTMAGPTGFRTGQAARETGLLENAAVVCEGDTVVWVGKQSDLDRSSLTDVFDVDCSRCVVLPGLVDCHTHTMFAGHREDEFALRAAGATYQNIAERGGGIRSTVRATREATKKELKRLTSHRLDQMLKHGTTTVEIKSGYGLDEKNEVKMLEALRELREEHYTTIVPTFLGAHAVPPEFADDPDGYLSLLSERLLPYIAQRSLSEFCDIFCEKGYFSAEDTRRYLLRARELGFTLRLHADQLNDIGASVVASEVGAASVDHLEHLDEKNIPLLRSAGTAAVLLPGSTFFLGGAYAPARALVDGGVPIAIASNFNPGSCMSYSLPMMMTIACTQMHLSVEECLTATTVNAAAVLKRDSEYGTIEPGKKADMVVFDAPSFSYIPYHFGENHARTVVKHGLVMDTA